MGEPPTELEAQDVGGPMENGTPDESDSDITVVEIPMHRDRGAHGRGRIGISEHENGLAGRFAGAVVMAGLSGARRLARTSSRLGHLAAASPPGRIVSEIAHDVVNAVAEESGIDWRRAGRRAEERLSRVIAVVVPVVVESIDPVTLAERIDVDAFLEHVDVNALLEHVDVNALLERVDVNALLDRVDVNALLERVDVDALMDRVEVGDVLTRGTGEVAGSALDLARRQAVGLDVVLSRTVDRILGRDPDKLPSGPRALAGEGGNEDGLQ